MSAHLPIRELLNGGCLPTGKREGILAMLRAYFDDSGTHDDSKVVVVGGLVGTVAQWEQLEATWAVKLADPLPEGSKVRLESFHLSACVGRWSDTEFADYNDAERDAVIHDFRQIILSAGLISS